MRLFNLLRKMALSAEQAGAWGKGNTGCFFLTLTGSGKGYWVSISTLFLGGERWDTHEPAASSEFLWEEFK